MPNQDDTKLLTEMFDAAVQAADPRSSLPAVLPNAPSGRTIVVGAGKGAAQMAAAFEDLWPHPLEGVVVTRYGYGASTRSIRVLEAAHPVPDSAGLEATKQLFNAVNDLGPDDLVVALICGGGSALLPAPPRSLSLEDEVALNQALLASGAPISAMNAIRKQVSEVKGGRLAAAAYPAKVITFVVSDVPGDDPAQVAAGPTVPDASDLDVAKRLIDTYRIELPPKILAHLESTAGAPDPNDSRFAQNEVHVIASANLSLEAAAKVGGDNGVPTVILSDAVEGEAKDVGQVHAALAREVATRNRPFEAPVILLSGGETTVTIQDMGGRGGRNTEFLLAFAKEIVGNDILALAADTDGIDGSEENAGAFADGSTWSRLQHDGHDPALLLASHDSWSAFHALGDLFSPGPTGTNVNDFRAILIRP